MTPRFRRLLNEGLDLTQEDNQNLGLQFPTDSTFVDLWFHPATVAIARFLEDRSKSKFPDYHYLRTNHIIPDWWSRSLPPTEIVFHTVFSPADEIGR